MPTVCELKIQAKAKGLTGYSKLKKDELIKLLKPKTTKATPANLKALSEKGKKKVLAITYKPLTVKNFKKNYLAELPDELITKIKEGAKETVNNRATRIFQNIILDDPIVDIFSERENEIYDYEINENYDSDKAEKMSEKKRDAYTERIEKKARKEVEAYTLKTIRKVVKENMKKSDKEIVKIFMEEL